MNQLAKASLVVLLLLGVSLVQGHGVRDRTRAEGLQRDTGVSASQAIELTLTRVEVEQQVLQTWIRTAATIDEAGRVLTATLCSSEKELVKMPDGRPSLILLQVS